MAQINVKILSGGPEYTFEVTVKEAGSSTQHQVTLQEDDYERLVEAYVPPNKLVEESFRFLLEREPKESILRSFDLTVISRYFPEYERTIADRF